MSQYNEKEIIREFRNKFGGNVWLGADRRSVEKFWLSKLAQNNGWIVRMLKIDMPKMKKGDSVGFMVKRKHFKIVRDD